ncbi:MULTISPECIES: hypothetical protein [Acetobacter]|uniref:Peptidase M41 domain-containing protein n=2 Tax=Acetobacter TaxID=434 RepID=A0AAN1PFY9_9PROT|nr:MULTISPECIES: hypothetical protein [Acetobacter]ASL41143.1 hypothetical protein CBI36_12600 [Acetobacter oryzifermentans]AXM99532.1 hypothetical protein CJF59_02320 [Acetobacter pomorum]KAA8394144.1 hypothetical protein FKW20_13865 [Acetobacter sp. DmW_125127]KAA8396760.1 hypothetical protein FKW22_05625 [Acetobacter sp. DmW_125124]KAA8399845.1 hypothetical protein FKW19_02880 [Acetobacter sp. DmW_125128]
MIKALVGWFQALFARRKEQRIEEVTLRQIPHLIDFETPSDEAICLHEAGHACAALVVELVPEFIEFVDDAGSQGRARNRIPVGEPQQRRLVACAAYAVEYNLYMAGRLTNATGVTIDQKAFIQLAIGSNAAHDKVQFFGENREGPDKRWPAYDDETFMATGQGLAKMLPMDLVVALAEAMLNERRVERERILEIAAPFFK